jgi:subtilisin family serine protease
MSGKIALALAAAALCGPPPASAADAMPNQLVVGFKSGAASSHHDEIVEGAGGRLRHRLRAIHARVVRPRSRIQLARLRRALLRNPDVAYVEPDYLVRASAVPSDTFFSLQYGLLQDSDADIDATDAWDTRTRCSKVAVLDTGVDTDHPDLDDNLWDNDEEKPGNGKDDDDNGYVDDHIGVDIRDGEGDGEDANGHGTHVAGVVAASGDNGKGVAGVCWEGSVMSVKFMNSRGEGAMSDAAEAIEYAVRHGARVLNCSFGSSSKSSALEDAIDYAKDKGALIVAAAGNEGVDIDKHPVYPAAYTDGNIISVTASTASDELPGYANYGDESVDVAAPGDEVVSTYRGGGYAAMSGTSMAAPAVAGAAAILKKQNSDTDYSDWRKALRKKVDKPGALEGRVLYDGRLNIRRALAYIDDL